MSIDTALERYFDAWNSHEPGRGGAALTDDGTYEDPTTGGPLSGDALDRQRRRRVRRRSPTCGSRWSASTTGDDTASAQWRMLGTNTGPLPGGPATGGPLDLPGADFFTYDAAADKVSSVVGYFDTATMLGQLGLQAHITPTTSRASCKFGISTRVETGRDTVPGSVHRHVDRGRPEHQPPLVETTTAIVMEQLGNEDYLGSCFATDRPPQLHLHRLDADRGRAGGAPRRRPHDRDEARADRRHRRQRPRRHQHVDTPLPQRRVPPAAAARLELSELGGQWL